MSKVAGVLDPHDCLTDPEFPFVTDEPGRRHHCRCGRLWVIREEAGVVVWKPDRGYYASSVTVDEARELAETRALEREAWGDPT